MKNSLIKNPEYKQILIKTILIFAILCIVMNICTYSLWTSMKNDLINQNISFIGKVVTQNPELENDVMNSFIQDATNHEYLNKGIDVASKYGYEPEINVTYMPIINKYYFNTTVMIIMFLIISAIFIFFVLNRSFRKIYGELNELTKNTQEIMNGTFNIKSMDKREGELSKLSFQLNRMSNYLQLTLEQLKNEKDFLKNMMSDISHQLKTPLTSLRMFNELLLDGAEEEPEIRHEFLEKSFNQLDRMEWLIQTLLKIGRLETGAIEINKENEDICKTLSDEIISLRFRFSQKKQQVIVNNLDKPVIFMHDQKWIGEAVRNIIKNAIDYTPENGKITISLEESNTIIRLRIKDNGIGISEKDIPYIFDRFYQGRNSKTITNKGSGIGLALAKLIVEKHNGFIEVSSSTGNGTEFLIVFPKNN